MKVLVLQNMEVPDRGGNYIPRDMEEMNKEYGAIRSFISKRYSDEEEIRFYRDDRFTPERIDNFSDKHEGLIKSGEFLHMALDLGVIASFEPKDLVIFSKDFYCDHYCSALLEICQLYGINYIIMQN